MEFQPHEIQELVTRVRELGGSVRDPSYDLSSFDATSWYVETFMEINKQRLKVRETEHFDDDLFLID